MRSGSAFLWVALLTGAAAGQPPALQLLGHRPVADDLALTEKQRGAVAVLAGGWRPARPRTATVGKKIRADADALDAKARALLTAGQAKRLAEIEQQLARRAAGPLGELLLPGVAQALELSDAQRQRLTDLRDVRQREAWALYAGDGGPGPVLARLKAHHAETRGRMLAVLTRKQRDALPLLSGKPFTWEVKLEPVPTFHRRESLERLHAVLEGLRFAASPSLHDELKLNAAQRKKLMVAAWWAHSALPIRPTDDLAGLQTTQARESEEALAGFLAAAQLARLKQIVIQAYAAPGDRGMDDMIRFVEVREALALSPKQVERLLDRERAADVLGDGQKAVLKAMAGLPWGKRLEDGRRRPPRSILGLLSCPDVGRELKITDAQAEAFFRIDMKLQDDPNKKAADDAHAAARKLLDAEQARRLDELRIRQHLYYGIWGLVELGAAAPLNLNAGQRERIAALWEWQTALWEAMSQELASARAAGGPANAPGFYDGHSALREATNRRMEAVLNAGQRGRLVDLMGKHFAGRLP